MANQQQNQYVQVLNNLVKFHHLPPTKDYPQGFRLVPGSNNVPADYVKALESFEVPFINEDGKSGKRKLFEELSLPNRESNGQPPVVVRGSIAKDAEQGPPPPHDLTGYADELALKVIEVTSDKEALRRWAKDNRPEVSGAAKAKSR